MLLKGVFLRVGTAGASGSVLQLTRETVNLTALLQDLCLELPTIAINLHRVGYVVETGDLVAAFQRMCLFLKQGRLFSK